MTTTANPNPRSLPGNPHPPTAALPRPSARGSAFPLGKTESKPPSLPPSRVPLPPLLAAKSDMLSWLPRLTFGREDDTVKSKSKLFAQDQPVSLPVLPKRLFQLI